MTIVFTLVTAIVGLGFALLADPYIHKEQRRNLLIILLLVFTLLIQNLVEQQTNIGPDARTIASVYGYMIRPVIIVGFMRLIAPDKRIRISWLLLGVNTAIYSITFSTQLTFWFNDANVFQRGPLGYTCHIISFILLLLLLFEAVKKFNNRKNEMALPVFSAAIIISATLLDTFRDSDVNVSYLTAAVVVSCILFYIWMHLQFVREHEKALVEAQKIKIMMSQIQPHFLYNTLSTIQALCRIDPEKAFDTTEKFGAYLRQNIDYLNREEMIPLEKELEHTRIYTEIEKIRFPNIRVDYDLADTDFFVPALSIQPIVENAIRHGVRGVDGGYVSITTKDIAGNYIIIIEDNGKGFDTANPGSPEEMHIGLENVRGRIEKLCAGRFDIRSVPGQGTKVVIAIPREQADRKGRK